MVEERFFPEGPHLIPAACPRCGGLVSVVEGGHIKCGYCGSEFLTRELFKTAASRIKDFYKRAYDAQEGGNFKEAYDYFSKVLEVAPTEYLAWFGKGTAAGYLSSSSMIRHSEVIYCFEKALSYAPEKDREEIKRTLGAAAGEIGNEMLDWLREHKIASSENLAQILELFKYWDAKDPQNEECWKSFVRLGETDVGDKETFSYPYWLVAREYSKKIREKFDASFSYDKFANPYFRYSCGVGCAIIILVIIILIVLILDKFFG